MGIGSTASCSSSVLFLELVSDMGRGVNAGGQGDKVGEPGGITLGTREIDASLPLLESNIWSDAIVM